MRLFRHSLARAWGSKPWASYLTSPCLSFLSCQINLSQRAVLMIERVNICKSLRRMPGTIGRPILALLVPNTVPSSIRQRSLRKNRQRCVPPQLFETAILFASGIWSQLKHCGNFPSTRYVNIIAIPASRSSS